MTTIAPRVTTKKPAKPTAAKPTAKKPAAKRAVKPVAKKPAVKAAAKPVAKTAAKTAPKKAAPVAKKTAGGGKLSAVTQLCKQLAEILDTNKAEEIVTLPLSELCSFADYMIVASGRAPRHVSALADYVGDFLKKRGTPPLSIEGKESGDWVLIDAGDIVIHIFRPEIRQFYNIEKMWAIPGASAR